MTIQPTFVDEEQVRKVLTYPDLVPAMRKALMDFSAGRVTQPVRSVLPVAAHSGWFAMMPAIYGNVMGAKLVTFYPRNADMGKHTHLAVIQLFRSDTGEPLAVMDGRLITEMRTAAVSAVAVDKLAHARARVLAILGGGVQARSHWRALSLVRQFDEVRIWSRSPERAQALAAEVGGRAVTAEEAVRHADVVVTVTSSPEPVLFRKWLRDDALVCAVGAVTPDRRELDSETMRGSVIVESREAAMREPGDILLAGANISAELGELLNGAELKQAIGPIVYKSVGIAVEDIASARLVFEKLQGPILG